MVAKRGIKSKAGTGRLALEIEPPPGLTDAELAEFIRLIDAMREIGTADRTDVNLVAATARTQVILDRAYLELNSAEKLTQIAANGTQMPHPMLAVINAQTMRLRGLLADLGLTPATNKLGHGKQTVKTESKWGDLIPDAE